MKKFLKKVLLFTCLVAVIDIVAGKVGDTLQANAKGGITKRINDLAMVDKHDVVILGSSRARHHYDSPFLSDTLGLDVYNAGVDGNGVILAEGLLELILERYHPKLVLLDVEPVFDIYVYKPDNNHVRYIGNLKPYYNHKAIGNIIRDISWQEWYKVHSGMVRYNSSLISMFIDNIKENGFDNCGYAPLCGKFDRIVEYRKTESVIDQLKLAYVEKIITLAKKNNIPFAVVASPKLGVETSESLVIVKK